MTMHAMLYHNAASQSGHCHESGSDGTTFRSDASKVLTCFGMQAQSDALHSFTMHAATEAHTDLCSLIKLHNTLQGHQQLPPEPAAGGSQAVAPCAVPLLDSPCPGEQSARKSVASPRASHHSRLIAAADSLTPQTASVPPASPPHMECTPIMMTLPPSEQASTMLHRSGRPASAAASATASAAASTAASSMLRRPTRTSSGTLSKPKAALPRAGSQVGQHMQHDSISSQHTLLQVTPATAAGLADGHFPQPVQQQASVMSGQPELGQATMARSALRRPSKLTLLPNEPNSQDGSLSPSTSSRRSPKPTLLRDQHLPGELLHQRTAFPSDILMRHEAACASPTPSQPDSPVAAGRPSSPSSALQHRQSGAEAQAEQPGGGSTLRPKSPKATLLRDQHLPGELLHQRTAFPSDIYMRHEAACAPGLGKQPADDSTSVLPAQQQSSTAVMPQQEQQVLDTELSRGTTLHAGAGKQTTLPRAVSFAAAFLEANKGTSVQAASTPRTSLYSVTKALISTLPRVRAGSTLPSPSGSSKEAAPDSSLLENRDGGALQAAVPSKLQRKGSQDAGPQPKPSLRRADSRLQHSSQQSSLRSSLKSSQRLNQAAPASPRSLAGPWFEATHHDLTRSNTWATQWLEMGAEYHDPTNPDFEQLQQQQQLSQRGSEHQPPLLSEQVTQQHAEPQPIQQQQLQHLRQQPHSEQDTTQEQPKVQTSQKVERQTASELLLPSSGATARSHQAAQLNALSTGTDRAGANASALQQQAPNRQLSQRQGRPQTAPEGFWSVAADAPWALDARRLHSARPGSGGSPTARFVTQMLYVKVFYCLLTLPGSRQMCLPACKGSNWGLHVAHRVLLSKCCTDTHAHQLLCAEEGFCAAQEGLHRCPVQ